MTIYPWQDHIWAQLQSSRSKLHHALLLRGRAGTGKLEFAIAFAQSLLCTSPLETGKACGSCASCGWFVQNNHPDFRLLTPEQENDNSEEGATAAPKSKKTQIAIAQIRELSSFLELSSHRNGGYRVIVVHPAEALNAASANALLKVLEEPPPGVIFLLISHQPHRLLPTIISRCQKIDMPVPTHEMALQWLQAQGVKTADALLQYAGGSPLAARQEAEQGTKLMEKFAQQLALGPRLDPFTAAPAFVAAGMESAINAMQKWIYDLLSVTLQQQARYHGPYAAALQALIKSVDLGSLLDFQRRLDEARKSANHPLNNELQLEYLLLQYTQLFSTRT